MNLNPIINIQPECPDVEIEIKVSSEGKDGYTPKRGVDYWTEEDKQEIVDDVKQEIGELPGGGTVKSVNGKKPDKNGNVVVDPELPSAWDIPSADPLDPMPYDKILSTEFGSDGEPKWVLQSPPSAEAVRYTAQTLNVNQQAQARKNIGAQPAGDYALKSEIPSVAVQSVNGKTGDVMLTADDVGAAKKEDIDRLTEGKANVITASAIGNNITLNDCATESCLKGVVIYGKTVQDGVPTHSTPIDLTTAGDRGHITVTVASEVGSSEMSFSTPNGLPGIPVSSGGNYTDDNGQMWLCDVLDYDRGIYIQNVIRYVFDGSRPWNHSLVGGSSNVYRHYIVLTDLASPSTTSEMPVLLCSHYSPATATETYVGKRDSTISMQAWGGTGASTSTAIQIYDTGCSTSDNAVWKAYLAENPITCLVGRTKPMEIIMTDEDLASIKFANIPGVPVTITNNDNAGMRVSYATSTKMYVDEAVADVKESMNDTSLAAMSKYTHVSRVMFTGNTYGMSKDDAVILEFEYRGAENYINDATGTGRREDGVVYKGYAKVKWQGTSSVNFPKKNYTVTFYTDAECTIKLPLILREKWGAQSKYCMKANWIDPSMLRNVIAAKLWAECVLSRPTNCESYLRMNSLPNAGAIDGYPVFTFINDAYIGLYTMNIPKDDWMFGMVDGEGTNVVLCGEAWNNATSFDGMSVIDGTDWDYEVKPADISGVAASFNRIYAALSMPESTEEEITAKKTAITACVDIYSVLDYWIYLDKLCITDNTGKNQLMVTYDGTKWIMSAYDLDTAFGLHWAGASYYGSDKTVYGNNLLRTVAKLFDAEYTERKAVLDRVLSIDAIYNKIDNFLIDVPEEAFRLEAKIWSDMAGANFNGIDQIKSFLTREKADKKDIPEPYTLPTASADVKGGVKIGDGLQMTGDVLGVVPDDDLIAHIVISGTDIANVYIDKGDDGLPFDLVYAKFRYRSPVNDTGTGNGINVAVYNRSGAYSHARVLTFIYGVPAAGKLAIGFGEVFVTAEGAYGYGGTTPANNNPLSFTYSETTNGLGLKCFSICTTTGVNFIDGTEIYIYGKRREAMT